MQKGKNSTRTRRVETYTAADHANIQEVKKFVQDHLFPSIKMWPKNWEKWHNNSKSICRRIMAKVGVPHSMTEEGYWTLTIASEMNDKLCALRANVKEAMRKQCEGNAFILLCSYDTKSFVLTEFIITLYYLINR